MAEQSLLAIEEADVVLFLVDARAGLTAADIGIANYLRQRTNKTTGGCSKIKLTVLMQTHTVRNFIN